MGSGEAKGRLVIVGGGEERPGEILREFVRLAGGTRARIAVLAAASSEPEALEDEYRDAFGTLGVKDVRCLRADDRGDAEARDLLKGIEGATAVFLTGGDQKRLIEKLGGTASHDAIRKLFAGGLVVGGTSAGASVMSEFMILEGESEEDPHPGVVKLGPGLGLLPGVVIDQHFTQRGRLGRLLGVLGERPGDFGVGIAEDTAVVVNGDHFNVIGSGSVTVLDGASLCHRGLVESDACRGLALCGVTLHSLPAGYSFDLKSRSPRPPARSHDAA